MPEPLHRRLLGAALLLLYGGAVAYLGTEYRDDLVELLHRASLPALLGALAAAVVFWLLTGLRFGLSVALFGQRLVFREWFGLTVLTKFVSYFVPARGGIAVRAVYLKRVHGFPLSRFASSTFLLYVLSLTVNAVTLLVLLQLVTLESRVGTGEVAAALGLIIVLSIGAVALAGRLRGSSRLTAAVRELGSIRARLRAAPGKVVALVGVQVFIRLVFALEIILCFEAVGVPVDPVEAALVSVLVAVSALFSLTPGNAGISEGLIVGGASLFGYPLAGAVLASLLYRIIDVVFSALVGGYFVRWGYSRFMAPDGGVVGP